MSSMFKKKGGPAFKPKIPSARARPAAPTPASSLQPAKPPQTETFVDTQPESVSQTSQKATPSAAPAVDAGNAASQESSQPPHQKSSTSTPPEPVLEPAKPDGITATKQTPSDKPESPENSAPEPTTIQEATVSKTHDEPETTTTRSAPATEPAQAQPTRTEAPIIPDVSTEESPEESSASPGALTHSPVEGPDSGVVDSPATSSIPAGEASDAVSQTLAEPPKKPAPRTRARKQAAKNTEQETGEEDEGARPKKRQRKATQSETDTAPKQPRKRKTPAQTNGESDIKKRRARSVTPEDSESQVVDLQQLKMSDLTRDLHIGKKFSRHDELRERERRARLKSKVGDVGSRDSSATPEPGTKTGSPAAAATPTPTPPTTAPATGPQFRIVDGQIVVDQSSLTVDRHARAAAALGDMETVEENDFTRLITSNSFMNTSKLKGPNIWTDAETELFYRGLRMFGTDFEMISKMFPGKQRRHVKLKYNREERHCPRLIDSALIGEKTVKLNIDEYKAFTGAEFESVESIEAEQRKIQEDFEAEQKRAADEQAEIMRKKREELFADDEDEASKKKKRKGKQKVHYGLNGEPIATES